MATRLAEGTWAMNLRTGAIDDYDPTGRIGPQMIMGRWHVDIEPDQTGGTASLTYEVTEWNENEGSGDAALLN